MWTSSILAAVVTRDASEATQGSHAINTNPRIDSRGDTTNESLHALGEHYSRVEVDVDGRPMCVGTWAGDSPPVLALHGISSNHLLWTWTALADPGLNIIAPDLQGRGGSEPGASNGLVAHRDSILRLMDVLGLESVTLAGMSMGGYVAVALAAAAPDRFRSVLLVDGGIPMAVDASASEQVLAGLQQRADADAVFTDVQSYVENYLAEFDNDLDLTDPVMHAFLGWNLAGTAPELRPILTTATLVADARDVFFDAPTASWLADLNVPTHLLHADKPMPTESPTAWADRVPSLTEQMQPSTDHASIVMGHDGGTAVAAAMRKLLQVAP